MMEAIASVIIAFALAAAWKILREMVRRHRARIELMELFTELQWQALIRSNRDKHG